MAFTFTLTSSTLHWRLSSVHRPVLTDAKWAEAHSLIIDSRVRVITAQPTSRTTFDRRTRKPSMTSTQIQHVQLVCAGLMSETPASMFRSTNNESTAG